MEQLPTERRLTTHKERNHPNRWKKQNRQSLPKVYERGYGFMKFTLIPPTAICVFHIENRVFRTITSQASDPQSADFSFTSSLPFRIFRLFASNFHAIVSLTSLVKSTDKVSLFRHDVHGSSLIVQPFSYFLPQKSVFLRVRHLAPVFWLPIFWHLLCSLNSVLKEIAA